MILIIDGSNYLSRAYYAVGDLHTSKGFPTGAIKGSINMILKDLKRFKPDGCVIVFDRGGKTWRHKLYPQYKANRAGTNEQRANYYVQLKPARTIFRAMGIKVFGLPNVEADDIIGTLAKSYAKDHSVVVASNDKDFAQLVDKRINILLATGDVLNIKGVHKKYGVYPELIVEYLMLLGDSSDNIPGVYSCGHTTASKMLTKYGSIKNILRSKTLTATFHKNLHAVKHIFNTTRKLITLNTELDLSVDPNIGKMNLDKLKHVCSDLELYNSLSQILEYNSHSKSLWK